MSAKKICTCIDLYLLQLYFIFSFQTETEIKYKEKKSQKTDYLCEIDRRKVAISVTRITSQYNPKIRQMAERVLKKKIESK